MTLKELSCTTVQKWACCKGILASAGPAVTLPHSAPSWLQRIGLHLAGTFRSAEISTTGPGVLPPRDMRGPGVITASNWAISVLSCMGEQYLQAAYAVSSPAGHRQTLTLSSLETQRPAGNPQASACILRSSTAAARGFLVLVMRHAGGGQAGQEWQCSLKFKGSGVYASTSC